MVASVGFVSSGAQGQVLDPVAGPLGADLGEESHDRRPATAICESAAVSIYSHGYFVTVHRRRWPGEDTDAARENDQGRVVDFYQMQGQDGRYRIDGNKLIRTAISAVNPTNEGVEIVSEFRIEGDTLITTGTNVGGSRWRTQIAA